MLQAAVTARPLAVMLTVTGEVPVEARADVVVVGSSRARGFSWPAGLAAGERSDRFLL